MSSLILKSLYKKLVVLSKLSLFLILLFANTTWAQSSNRASHRGNLNVFISGLPTAMPASVGLIQLNGDYSHFIVASGSFVDLEVGEYIIAAAPVNVQGVEYEVFDEAVRRVTVTSNSNQSTNILYQQSNSGTTSSGMGSPASTPVTVLPSSDLLLSSAPISNRPTTSIPPVTLIPVTPTAPTPVTILPFPNSPPLNPNSPQPVTILPAQPTQPTAQPELPIAPVIDTNNASAEISLNEGNNTLIGRVFYDKNNNSISDANESPIAHMQVFLDLNFNDRIDADEPLAITDVSGNYGFTGLANKKYRVMQNLPFSWSNTVAPKQTIGTIAGGVHRPEIVGGGFASFEDYPFIAAIALRHDITSNVSSSPQGFSWCGGSLIASNWVLTAAHCVYNPSNPNDGLFPGVPITNQNLSVFTGGNLIRNQTVDASKMTDVVKIVIHPDYDDISKNNDIALLQLKSPLYFPRTLLPDPSVEEQLYRSNTMSTVLGWGSTLATVGDPFHKPLPSEFLKKADVPIWSQRDCVLLPSALYRGVTAQQFCAGYEQGLIDSCQGDSGGPLVVNNNSMWYQAGIVSTGAGCAQPNQPGIYVRVSEYINWILENAPPEMSQKVDVDFSAASGQARIDFGNFR